MRKIVYQDKTNKKIRKLVLTRYENSYILDLSTSAVLIFKILNTKIRIIGGGTMLTNLEKVRKQNKVSLVDIADLLEVRYQTVSDKINGISDFKFGEALLIKNTFFQSMKLSICFREKKKKSHLKRRNNKWKDCK